jgi:preprotein translocase subunit SecG
MLGGVQKTNDFLDKSTWTLAGVLIVLIILSSMSFTGSLSDNQSKIINNAETAAPKTATPATPKAATPATATPAPAETAPAQPAK